MIFRLYPPGEGGDGDDDGVKRLKARLSRDFVATAIAARFLYCLRIEPPVLPPVFPP